MSKPKTLRPISPNAGLEDAYRKKLISFLEEMNDSYIYWIKACYNAKPPNTIAEDHWTDGLSPTKALKSVLSCLSDTWTKKLNKFAPALAGWFVKKAVNQADTQFKSALRDLGVKFSPNMSRSVRDGMQASIAANVSLIKSISKDHHSKIEGMVYRSVMAGHDVKMLADELQGSFGVTRRRAEFIARDQNNKANAMITRERQRELGIKQAIWVHTGRSKVPRQSHLEMNGKPYDVENGILLADDPYIVFPGTAVNCQCRSRSILPERKL